MSLGQEGDREVTVTFDGKPPDGVFGMHKLMFDERGLGNDGTEASGQCKPHDSDDQVNEKDERMTTSRILAWYQNPKKRVILVDAVPTDQHRR